MIDFFDYSDFMTEKVFHNDEQLETSVKVFWEKRNIMILPELLVISVLRRAAQDHRHSFYRRSRSRRQ